MLHEVSGIEASLGAWFLIVVVLNNLEHPLRFYHSGIVCLEAWRCLIGVVLDDFEHHLQYIVLVSHFSCAPEARR